MPNFGTGGSHPPHAQCKNFLGSDLSTAAQRLGLAHRRHEVGHDVGDAETRVDEAAKLDEEVGAGGEVEVQRADEDEEATAAP